MKARSSNFKRQLLEEVSRTPLCPFGQLMEFYVLEVKHKQNVATEELVALLKALQRDNLVNTQHGREAQGAGHLASTDSLFVITHAGRMYLEEALREESMPSDDPRSTGSIAQVEQSHSNARFREIDVAKLRRQGFEEAYFKSRAGQSKFREQLWGLHKQCLLTGCCIKEAVEAAHIVAYSESSDGAFDSSNGLILRGDIHSLFDRGRLVFRPQDGKVTCILSKQLRNTVDYKDFHLEELVSKSLFSIDTDALQVRCQSIVSVHKDEFS